VSKSAIAAHDASLPPPLDDPPLLVVPLLPPLLVVPLEPPLELDPLAPLELELDPSPLAPLEDEDDEELDLPLPFPAGSVGVVLVPLSVGVGDEAAHATTSAPREKAAMRWTGSFMAGVLRTRGTVCRVADLRASGENEVRTRDASEATAPLTHYRGPRVCVRAGLFGPFLSHLSRPSGLDLRGLRPI
jgi:hypothetical protein